MPVTVAVSALVWVLRPVLYLTSALARKLTGGKEKRPVTSVEEIRLLAALGRSEGALGPRVDDRNVEVAQNARQDDDAGREQRKQRHGMRQRVAQPLDDVQEAGYTSLFRPGRGFWGHGLEVPFLGRECGRRGSQIVVMAKSSQIRTPKAGSSGQQTPH